MILLNIPGHDSIKVKNIVFDFNGTLAVDGVLVAGLSEKMDALSQKGVDIYILTADTFGTTRNQCQHLPVKIEIFSKENVSRNKEIFVKKLGPENTITVGNGRNDFSMFAISILSICVIGKEGCCTKSMMASDIVVNNPMDALDLLLNNDRIVATFRT